MVSIHAIHATDKVAVTIVLEVLSETFEVKGKVVSLETTKDGVYEIDPLGLVSTTTYHVVTTGGKGTQNGFRIQRALLQEVRREEIPLTIRTSHDETEGTIFVRPAVGSGEVGDAFLYVSEKACGTTTNNRPVLYLTSRHSFVLV